MLALYGSVGVVAGLAQAVYLGAAFVLAAHLLGRARRRRDLAPFLLGVNLLFAMGFGYLLCSAGMATAMLSAMNFWLASPSVSAKKTKEEKRAGAGSACAYAGPRQQVP